MKRVVSLLFVTLLFATIVPNTANGEIENESSGEVFIVSVDSTNLRFSPSDITLNEGDSVRFFWSGELLPHNAVEKGGLFNSGDASRDVDFLYRFEIGQNGTYEFVCEPHESLGMIGTINVEPLVVTDEPILDENETAGDIKSEASKTSNSPFLVSN